MNLEKIVLEMIQRLTRLEDKLNNELHHQLRFNRWLLTIFAGLIVGLTIIVVRVYLFGG